MPRIVHFEIHAGDPQRAVAFYTEAFGWEITRWGENPYWLVRTGTEGDGIDGGLMPRRGPAPEDGQPFNAFPCTLAVDDLDAALIRVEKHGGRVTSPRMPIQGVGWIAYVKDTEGNILGLLEADPNAE